MEFFRFAIVGVLATAVHYFIYWLTLQFMNASLAYSLGYGISFIMNFILTSLFTFRVRPSLVKGAGFGLSHLLNYFIQLGLLNLFLYMNIPAGIAPLPVFMIVIPINFLLVRFVFKKR